jgi:prepilin-type processing-associated H-X9-DG protein
MGLALLMYANDNQEIIPRANNPLWYSILTANLGGRNNMDYFKIKTFVCPAYPAKQNLISYVVNGWYFTSLADVTGVEWDRVINPTVPLVSKVTGIQVTAETIYLADDQYDMTRAFTATNSFTIENYDVWSPFHLPFNSAGIMNSQGFPYARRVSHDRHGKGPALLYFDGHVQTKDARQITVNDWRDRKY